MHTPGPWEISHQYFTELPELAGMQIVAEGDKYLIAAIGGYDLSIDETKANAHLVTAAPELLESTEKLLEWVNNLERSIGKDQLIDAMPNNFGRQVAVRALAKAKGG